MIDLKSPTNILPPIFSDVKPTEVDTEENRSRKALMMHDALGEVSPGTDSIKADFDSGYENRQRELLKQQKDIQEESLKVSLIGEIAQGDVTEDSIEIVRGLTSSQLSSPALDVILETEYAKQFQSDLAMSFDDVEDAQQEDSNKFNDALDIAEFQTARNLVVHDLSEKTNARLEKEGFLSYGQAFLEQMVPFKSAYNVHDIFSETTSIIPGDNLEEQYSYLFTLPPEEFKTTLTEALDKLYDTNILDAQAFLKGVTEYSSSDKWMDNAFGVVDAASFIPVGMVGRLASRAAKGAKLAATNPKEASKVLAELGENAKSSSIKVAEDIKDGSFFKLNKNKDIEISLPSIFSPGKMFEGSSRMDGQAVERLKAAAMTRTATMEKILNHQNLVERLTDEELAELIDDTADAVKDIFPNIRSSVINVSGVDDVVQEASQNKANAYQVAIQFGRTDGTLFATKKGAENFAAKKLKPKTDTWEVKSNGDGHYVEIKRPLDETKARDLEIPLDSITPDGIIPMRNFLRGADYLVSKSNARARAVAVQTQEHLADMFVDATEPLRKGLSKSDKQELNKIWELNRDFSNGKDQAPGMFFKNVEELETEFVDKFGKLPTENQVDAYFTYVQINDLDYMIRDLDWFKQKSRMGIEKFSFKVDKDQIEIEGKQVDKLPVGSHSPFRVKVVDPKGGVKNLSSKFLKQAEIDKLLSQGYKIIQNSRESTFYLTKGFKRNPVGLQNINYRPGGHRVYRHGFYGKQAKIKNREGTNWYTGDTTLFNASTIKEAEEIAGLFDQARIMLKNKDKGLKSFIDDNLPWISYKSFMNKVKSGAINPDIPIRATRAGQKTLDNMDTSGIDNLVDTTSSEHSLVGNLTGRFMGERDAQTIDTLVEEGGTVFRLDEDQFLDPMSTVSQSTSNMLRTRVMNDYQIKSASDFTREFADILDYKNSNELDFNPFAYLYEARYKAGADPERVKKAEGVRHAVVNLNGFRTLPEKILAQKKERILASVSSTLGKKSGAIVEERLLPSITNVDQYMRSVAFQSKMGFLNFRQLPLQASAVLLAATISPKAGLKSMASIPTFMVVRNANPKIAKQVFQRVNKTTGGLWKEDEFFEALDLFKNSGFFKVGQDVAYMDQFKSPDITSGLKAGVKNTLNKGAVFFNTGEQIARQVGFFTAYSEFKSGTLRGMKAGAKLDRRAEALILQRAQDLTANMTRNTNSQWQKGYSALVTQFYSWNFRLSEQMLTSGSAAKLTPSEKARLFSGVSLLYGLPVGASMALPIPFREMIREQLIESGVDPDEEWYEVLTDGLLSSLGEYVTGTDFDVSSSFGPAGYENVWDYFRGDAEFSELMLGASGSIISEIGSDLAPIIKGIKHSIDLDDSTVYPILASDIVKPFRNISTVNNFIALYEATNVGKWVSKNGTEIIEMNEWEGLTKFLTGTSPQEVSDTFNRIGAMKDIKEHRQKLEKEMTSLYKKALQSEDYSIRKKLFSEIKAIGVRGGFTNKELVIMSRRAMKSQNLTDSIMQRYERDVKQRIKLQESLNGE